MFIALLAIALGSTPTEAAPVLPTPVKDAALLCAKATILASPSVSRMRLTAQVTHYFMIAAQADPGARSFLDRTAELGPEATKLPIATDAAPALAAQCDQRFPAARASVAAVLPADPFARDVTCFATLAVLRGAAETLDEDNRKQTTDRIDAVFNPLSDRITEAALNQHHLKTAEDFKKYMSLQLQAMLPKANPEYVAKACGLSEL